MLNKLEMFMEEEKKDLDLEEDQYGIEFYSNQEAIFRSLQKFEQEDLDWPQNELIDDQELEGIDD